MVQDVTHTAPKSVPTGTGRNYLGDLALAGVSGAITGPAFILDAPGYVLRAAADFLPTIDAFGAEMTDSEPLGRDFAAAVQKAIPADYFTKNLQNALLLGHREEIASNVGELPFLIGGLFGNVAGAMKLASKYPKVFDAFDKATDIMSATPARAIMKGANTFGKQSLAGLKIGAMGSLFPAIDIGYDAVKNEFHPEAAAGTMLGGSILGLAIPSIIGGIAFGGAVARSTKELLKNITRATSERLFQSNTAKITREMAQKQEQAIQMHQMAQDAGFTAYTSSTAAIDDIARINAAKFTDEMSGTNVRGEQEVRTRPVGEYDQAVDSRTLALEERTRFEADKQEILADYNTKLSKAEKDINTADQYIAEIERNKGKVKVSNQEIDEAYTGPKSTKELRESIRARKANQLRQEQAELLRQRQVTTQKIANMEDLMQNRIGSEQLAQEMQRPPETVLTDLRNELKALDSAIKKNTKTLEKPLTVSRQEFAQESALVKQQKEQLKQDLLQQKQAELDSLQKELQVEGEKALENYFSLLEEKQQFEAFNAPEVPEVQLPVPYREQGIGTGFTMPDRPGVGVRPRSTRSTTETVEGGQVLSKTDTEGKTQSATIFRAFDDLVEDGTYSIQTDETGKVRLVDETTGENVQLNEKLSPEENVENLVLQAFNEATNIGVKQLGGQAVKTIYQDTPIAATKKDKIIPTITSIAQKLARYSPSFLGPKVKQYNLTLRKFPVDSERRLSKLLKLEQKYINDKNFQKLRASNIDTKAKAEQFPADYYKAAIEAQAYFKEQADYLRSRGHNIPEKEFYLPTSVKDLDKWYKIQQSRLSPARREELLRTMNSSDTPEEKKYFFNRNLEKAKTVEVVDDELVDAYASGYDAIMYKIREYAAERAKGDMLGSIKDTEGTTASNGVAIGKLVTEAALKDNMTPQQIEESIQNLFRLFTSENAINSPVVGSLAKAISILTVTGTKIGFSQGGAFFTSWWRTNLFSAVEGGLNALKALGGVKPSFADQVGASRYIGEINQADQMGILSNLWFEITRYDRTFAEKSSSVVDAFVYPYLNLLDFLDKETILQSHFKFLQNNPEHPDVKAFYERVKNVIDVDKVKKKLQEYKLPDKKSELIDPDVLQAAGLYGGEVTVMGPADKTMTALSKSSAARMVMGLQSYALKMGSTLADETILATIKGFKQKDPKMIANALGKALSFFAIVVPGTALLSKFGTAVTEGVPVSDLPQEVAKDFDKELIRTALFSPFPGQMRPIRWAAGMVQNTPISQKVVHTIDSIFPGGSRPAMLAADAATYGFDMFDPAINPRFNKIPPMYLTEAIKRGADVPFLGKALNPSGRNFSLEQKLEREARYGRSGHSAEDKRFQSLIQAGYSPDDAYKIVNTKRGRRVASEVDRAKRDIKRYGQQLDPMTSRQLEVARGHLKDMEYEVEQAIMNKLRRGEISEQRARELWSKKTEIAKMNVLKRRGKI